MKFSVLSSNSNGNSSFVHANNNRILIDAGLSGKKIIEHLENIKENIKNIDAIIVTHEHGDHIKGLGVLSRKFDIPIYMHKDSYNVSKSKIGKIDEKNLNLIVDGKFLINDTIITAFPVLHDAAHCLGFTIEEKRKKLSFLTDLGYVSNTVKNECKNSDILAIESNYDYNMLMNGPYPWDIKTRVKGRYGHLSNDDAKKVYEHIRNFNLKKIYLMHISRENNTFSLAYDNMKKIIDDGIELEVSLDKETKIFEI